MDLVTSIQSSAAGFFLGTFCPEDGPNERESYYFTERDDALAVYGAWIKTPTRPFRRGSMFMADERIVGSYARLTERDREFLAYHADNPQIYAFFVGRLAFIWRPNLRIGMSLLVNQMRWQSLVRAKRYDTEDDFSFNDKHESRYGRLITAEHPEWFGVFETRELHT